VKIYLIHHAFDRFIRLSIMVSLTRSAQPQAQDPQDSHLPAQGAPGVEPGFEDDEDDHYEAIDGDSLSVADTSSVPDTALEPSFPPAPLAPTYAEAVRQAWYPPSVLPSGFAPLPTNVALATTNLWDLFYL
jgi:hypothetical protein